MLSCSSLEQLRLLSDLHIEAIVLDYMAILDGLYVYSGAADAILVMVGERPDTEARH
jgi:hypothetical protein